MSATPSPYVTVEEYLAIEESSEEKYEYWDGQIYLMAGAAPNHNLIASSVNFAIYSQLRGKGCFVFSSDMRVKEEKTNLYTYPDLTIVCGTPSYEDTKPKTLTNPTVVIEILSPSTERADRGRKFQHYRNLDTLQEYVLISPSMARVEVFFKQSEKTWLFTDISDINDAVKLSSIDCTLQMKDIYDQVSFDDES